MSSRSHVRNRARRHGATLLTVVALLTHAASADTIHVPGDYAGIQEAIDAAADGDEIVLAPGTHAGGVSMLGKAITLRSTDPGDPDIVAATIVAGGDDIITVGGDVGPETVVAGLTLTGGGYWDGCCFPTGCGTCFYGAGISADGSPTIIDCVFHHAASMALGIVGSPTIVGCTFLEANDVPCCTIYIDGDPVIDRCRFIDCTSDPYTGLTWLRLETGGTLTNCVFRSTTTDLADMLTTYGAAIIDNCTFWGGFIGDYPKNGESVIRNSIVWNGGVINLLASHCIIEDGIFEGDDNLDVEPEFIDAASGDLRLRADSPAIDAGDSTLVPAGAIDMAGNPRLADDPATPDTGVPDGAGLVVDIGAYEFGSGDCNGNGTVDASDIFEGTSSDCDVDGVPDECEESTPDACSDDCNGNGVPDLVDIVTGSSEDCDGNSVPDECDADCNDNGSPDGCDIDGGLSQDCNGNLVPDECDVDCNSNGLPDDCDLHDPITGHALDFAGGDEHVIMDGFTGFPSDQITVSFWEQSVISADDALFSYFVPGTNREFAIWNPGFLVVGIDGDLVTPGTDVHDGSWHNIAVTWRSDSGEVVLYVDGVQRFQSQAAQGGVLDGGGTLVLGQLQGCAGGCFDSSRDFKGLLDEVRIWNVVRTAEEIQADMFHTLNGDEPGLVGLWRLDEGTGSLAADAAGANHGTVNGPDWVETRAFTCCPADIDGSGEVDVDDLVEVILAWGGPGPVGDVDFDGLVGVEDLVAVILAWGPCPE